MNDRKMPPKPAFNVTEPFMGIMMVQLNKEMCDLLKTFISNVGHVEEELLKLCDSLGELHTSSSYICLQGPSFSLSKDFMNTYVLRINKEMRDLLIDFITDIEGGVEKIVWAFHLALKNPEGPREVKKKYLNLERFNGPRRYDRYAYGGEQYRR